MAAFLFCMANEVAETHKFEKKKSRFSFVKVNFWYYHNVIKSKLAGLNFKHGVLRILFNHQTLLFHYHIFWIFTQSVKIIKMLEYWVHVITLIHCYRMTIKDVTVFSMFLTSIFNYILQTPSKDSQQRNETSNESHNVWYGYQSPESSETLIINHE